MPANMPDVGDFLTEVPPIPEDEFAVYGTIYARAEHADALEQIYAEMTRMAASETGTLHYCISRDGDDPTVFHFFERYAGKAAFEAHSKQPMIKKLKEDNLIKGVKAKFAQPIEPMEK